MWEKFLDIVAEAVAGGLRNSRANNLRGATFKDRIELVRNKLRDRIISSQMDADGMVGLAVACSLAAESVREIGRDCQSKRDNMPYSLQDYGTGELLQVRAAECDKLADSLDQAYVQIRGLNSGQLNEAVQIVMSIRWDCS